MLDIETDLSHQIIWLVITKDIDSGEKRIWKAADNLSEYLKGDTQIIGQNIIAFDAPILNRIWKTAIQMSQCYDTLLVSRLLDPSREKGHSLNAWGQTLGLPKIDYKGVWEWLKGRREEYKGECFNNPHHSLMSTYCARDIDVTEKLFLHLEEQIEQLEFSKQSVALEHSVAIIIAEQERNGFKLDKVSTTCLLTNVKGRLADIYEEMQQRWPQYTVARVSEKTGKSLTDGLVVFNPGSRKQIAERLRQLGWKPKKFTKKGQVIVDETVLQSLKFPEAKLIAEYMMLQKRIAQLTSWLEAVEDDGRVHGKVVTNGAVTGRMTHSSPNMAQVPNSGSVFGPECRECWSVEKGNVLVGVDASGLELRMLAHYMKDQEYVKTVCEGSSKNGTDVHTINQIAAELQTRDEAKTFIYAFLYGAGDAKIGSIVGGNAKTGKDLKEKFLKKTPSLDTLIKHVKAKAMKGYLPGLDERRVWVRSEHAALNSLLQSAGAIVMKQALVLFYDKMVLNRWPVKIVANIHDEFQLEVKESYGDIVGEAAKQSIIEAGLHFNLRCPLDGEYKIGRNWRETH